MKHTSFRFSMFGYLPVVALVAFAAACASKAPSGDDGTGAGGDNPGAGTSGGATAGSGSASPGSGSGAGAGSTAGGNTAGGTAGSGGADAGPPKPVLTFFDDDLYTGFDGTHPYQLVGLAFVYDEAKPDDDATLPFSTPPTFTVDPPNVVEVAPTARPAETPAQFLPNAQWFSVKPKAAGTAKVTVSYSGMTATSTVHVKAYTAAQWELGKTRYTAPANPSATRTACSGCHTPQGDKVVAPTHGAFFQSWIPDQALLSGIKTGKIEDYELQAQGGHKWELTAEEEGGIVAYLRSLNPFGK